MVISLSTVFLVLFVFFTSMANIDHPLISTFAIGVIGLVYVVLVVLSLLGIWDGQVGRRRTSQV